MNDCCKSNLEELVKRMGDKFGPLIDTRTTPLYTGLAQRPSVCFTSRGSVVRSHYPVPLALIV